VTFELIAKFAWVLSRPIKKQFIGSAVVVVALLLTGMVRGQGPVNAWLGDAERSRFERLREDGCEALYNLNYAQARAAFSEIVRLFPEHPAGPQYLATTLLLERLYKSRRIQASLYSTKSFYSKSEDKEDPEVVKQFQALTSDAQRLALARHKIYPKDAEALYVLGNVAALKATFEEAVEMRHTAALRDGSDAVELHRRVVKLDPTFIDARLTIGMYDYIVGSLPVTSKVVAGLFGVHGSKKRGLATVERVAKEGKHERDQAATLLILMYMREKRYGEAAELARQVSAKYPHNYVYRLQTADALVSQATIACRVNSEVGDADALRDAFAIYAALLQDKEVASKAGSLMDLIHFKYGEALFKAGRTQQAAAEFLAATRVEEGDEALATMAHLCAARALDAGNRRAEALAEYRLVLSRPAVYDTHDEARKGLSKPYEAEAISRIN
jgi:tetratricopeptide (TPR) repeat protein